MKRENPVVTIELSEPYLVGIIEGLRRSYKKWNEETRSFYELDIDQEKHSIEMLVRLAMSRCIEYDVYPVKINRGSRDGRNGLFDNMRKWVDSHIDVKWVPVYLGTADIFGSISSTTHTANRVLCASEMVLISDKIDLYFTLTAIIGRDLVFPNEIYDMRNKMLHTVSLDVALSEEQREILFGKSGQ